MKSDYSCNSVLSVRRSIYGSASSKLTVAGLLEKDGNDGVVDFLSCFTYHYLQFLRKNRHTGCVAHCFLCTVVQWIIMGTGPQKRYGFRLASWD